MAVRGIETEPQRPRLTVEEKRGSIRLLERRIAELNAYDAQNAVVRGAPEQRQLEAAISGTLTKIFGDRTTEFRRYSSATILHQGPVIMGRHPLDEIMEHRKYLTAGKANAIAMLGEAIKFLEEEIEFADPPAVEMAVPAKLAGKPSNKVFIVHGHDEAARESVARFLKQGDLEPVILHEKANEGRMVLQKFMDSADVGFAVVLLTPDDFGGAKGKEASPRARQNVILELGYFIGKLGPSRVCAMKSGDIELPSDILGIAWTPFDRGWKMDLWKELKAAGYDVSLEKMVG